MHGMDGGMHALMGGLCGRTDGFIIHPSCIIHPSWMHHAYMLDGCMMDAWIHAWVECMY